ncbi:hypothetical protein Skr01_24480 [Sphaerisporangium krabiense]|nr:hypothetical protein Skr01_24480 [Sphaerisporangium krabiense]
MQDVLDGERVQAEFLADDVEMLGRRRAQVEPYGGRGVLQVIGYLGDRETLCREDTIAIEPGAYHVRQD